MAEGLKALPATYRFTHNKTCSYCIALSLPLYEISLTSDLHLASQGWDLLFQYHGRPSGIFGADEYLAGLQAVRGYVFIPNITPLSVDS